MYQPPVPGSGRSAFVQGASTGLIAGIVQTALVLYATHANLTYPASNFLLFIIPISLLLWIALFLLVGVFAARRTAKVSTGTLAGLWAGLSGGVASSIGIFIAVLSAFPFGYNGPGYLATLAAIILTYLIFMALFMLGVGTGLGALGGLIGQSISPVRTTAHIYVQTRQGERQSQYPVD